jgi:methyl-accepting chemotaxis protein
MVMIAMIGLSAVVLNFMAFFIEAGVLFRILTAIPIVLLILISARMIMRQNLCVREQKKMADENGRLKQITIRLMSHAENGIKKKYRLLNQIRAKMRGETEGMLQDIDCRYNLSASDIEDIIVKMNDEEDRIMNEINTEYEEALENRSDEMRTGYGFYEDVHKEFLDMISSNINNISVPLSEKIFDIRKSINIFINGLEEWKKLSSENSSFNFTNIVEEYNELNNNLDSETEKFRKSFIQFKTDLGMVLELGNKVNCNVAVINGISEKVKLLSINASIESVRAGKYGNGFKVISNEINKLSEEVQKAAKNITREVMDANESLNKITEIFITDQSDLNENIVKVRNKFGTFYEVFTEYNRDFKKIFSSILEVSDAIILDIDKINPIFQMNDLIYQQINNLIKIFDKSRFEFPENGMVAGRDEHKKRLESMMDGIGDIITTDDEIVTINRILGKYDLGNKEIKTGTGSNIEIF